MKTALTIHLGEEFVFAAVEVDDQIDLLALTDSETGMPAREAFSSEKHFDGDSELSLANLLSKILARCLQVIDVYPDQVLIVRTEGGLSPDVCLTAAKRAQIVNVKVVEENRSLAALASYGPKRVSPDYAPVIGALYWNRHGDAPTGSLPIVTKEDLGANEKVIRKPAAAPSPPSVISLDDRSVFDLKINGKEKKRLNLSWLLAVLVVGIGVAVSYFFIFSDSKDSSQNELETAVSPVSSVPVSSVPVSSVPVSSVPVSDPTDTEEVVETEVRKLGVVTLAENGLLLLAGTENQLLLAFDTPQETVMSSLISVLGEPIEENLTMEDVVCFTPNSMAFKFAELEVIFAPYDQGPIFSQWFVADTGAADSELWTLNRIGVGSSVSELKELPQSQILIEEVFPGTNDPAGKFRIDPFGLGMFIHGLTSSTNDQGKILQMWAGEECQRLSVG